MASADIRLKYNEVVEKCRESGEPIYLTKNGQGEVSLTTWLLAYLRIIRCSIERNKALVRNIMPCHL